MDYRKQVVFGENWSPSRYKVLPYFAVEKRVLAQPGVQRIVDVGCAAGWNMSRFVQYGLTPVGLDVVYERVRLARRHGAVALGSGLDLPLAASSVDAIYIQHVLHHIGDPRLALREVARVLRPDGRLFLVETIEDSPLIRWGRRLHPSWLGDEVNASFTYSELLGMVEEAGLRIQEGERYSVLFWLWEMFPDRFPSLEKATPAFVALEQAVSRVASRYSAHCYLVAQPCAVTKHSAK
jgi:SAM-dependent methyltransferase